MFNSLYYSLYAKYINAIVRGMRYTFKQFKEEYPDDNTCLDSVFQNRYGDLECCPKCGVVKATFHRVKKRQCYACAHCGHQLYPLADTIFRKSSTPLWNWFYAIYLFSVAKNGVSAKELERHLGVTYKTAWRMCKQIRILMADEGKQLGGDKVVEIDEAYVGDISPNRVYENKSIVFGAVERKGRIKVKHVKSSGARVLLPGIEKSIVRGARVTSDKAQVYKTLGRRGYSHTTVNHSKLEYVRGDAHTNTIEGFWGQLKRSLDGTYHRVSPKYLQLYINEFVFRYNYRTTAVGPILLEQAGKRV